MKLGIVILAGISCLFGKCWALEPQWQEVTRGIVNVKTVLVRDNPKVILIGTDRGIFKTEDGGGAWRNVFSIRGDNHTINYLAADAQDKGAIYAATGAGVYFSANEGQRWNRIFKGKNSSESDCAAVVSLAQGIYLGTKAGLFVSKDKGRSWRKEPGKLGDSRVFNIACLYKDPHLIYVACADGVFKSADSSASWERVYITHAVENGGELEENNEDRDEEERHSEIRYISIDPDNASSIYLATSRGVYKSKDQGGGWALLSEYGLLSHDTQFILSSEKSEVYAAAKSGIFVYQNEEWRELSFNLTCRYVNFLRLDKDGNLYACTEKGLFKSNLNDITKLRGGGMITEYCKSEPKIEDVQKQAIR